MPNYLYRGTTLNAANEAEFANQRIEGFTAEIYRGIVPDEQVHKTVPKGTPVDELPWEDPSGNPGEPLATEQGVTGGLSDVIGTGIGFASGAVPLVFYLHERSLNGTGTRVRYTYDFFSSMPGALAWVYGGIAKGEIHTESEGLLGITSHDEGTPVVWEWGHDDIRRKTMQYEEENEVLVFEDHIDISGAVESTAIVLEGRRDPAAALGAFDGYHAGFGDEGESVARWSDEEIATALHREVRESAEAPLSDLWTLNLNSSMQEKLNVIPRDDFEWAFDGDRIIEDYDAVPQHLMGTH